MKKTKHFLMPALALTVLIASCSKDDVTPNINTNTNTNTTTQPQAPTPKTGDVDGVMAAIRTTVSTTQAGYTFDVNTDFATALFYTSNTQTSTYVDGGTVTVNDTTLDKSTTFLYTKSGLTSDLGFDGTINWTVSGNGSVPAITYAAPSTPEYTGTIATTITKTDGLTLSFTSSNTTGADSVYVLIASGSTSVLKSYSPTAGSVTINASDLSGLTASTTAFLEVVPFRVKVKQFNGKQYAFVSEKAIVKTVTIK